MVGVTKIQRGNAGYWLAAVAEGGDDYYTKPGEAPGEWVGDLADELGLHGKVDPAGYGAILEGRDPTSGAQLLERPDVRHRMRPDGSEKRVEPVLGYDVRFSAPKSVSLLYAVGSERTRARIVAVMNEAVRQGISYLESEACMVQRGRGGSRIERGEGFVGMAFRHRMSRAGDPALHVHVVISNLTRASSDGKWLSLASPKGRSPLFPHGKSAGVVFQAALRAGFIREFGLRFEEVRNGYADLKGFSRELIEAFSTRAREIAAWQEQHGVFSVKAAQAAAYRTRSAKDHGVDPDERSAEWAAQAAPFGLTRNSVEEMIGKGRAREPRAITDREAAAAIRRLERTSAHFDRRALLCALAEQLPEGADGRPLTAAVDRVLAGEKVVRLSGSSDLLTPDVYATPRVLELERRFIESALGGRDAGVAVVDQATVDRILGARSYLGDDQREMVVRLVTGGEQVIPVAAWPGTGKTTALEAAAEAWTEAGIPVFGCATARSATAELIYAGVTNSFSITSLRYQIENQGKRLPDGAVILVDEASMTNTFDLEALRVHVSQVGGKLVPIGDTRQIGAIGPGGLYAHAVAVLDPIVLTTIRRQHRDADRKIVTLVHEGRGSEALDLLRSDGRLIVGDDLPSTLHGLLLDWHRDYATGADVVMIARRNRDVDHLNQWARQLRREQGHLGQAELIVGGCAFSSGDRVLTRINARDVSNRERWDVISVNPLTRSIKLRLVGRPQRTVTLNRSYLDRTTPEGAPALQYAYAITKFGAESKTFDRAYALLDPGATSEEELVALSRGREIKGVYAVASSELLDPDLGPGRRELADALQDLRESIEREGGETSAVEVPLRRRIESLSRRDLADRRRQLVGTARAADPALRRRDGLEKEIGHGREVLQMLAREREATELLADPPADEIARLAAGETSTAERLKLNEAEFASLPPATAVEPRPPATADRLEATLIEQRISQMVSREVAMARAGESDVVYGVLGPYPPDGAAAAAWSDAAHAILTYRLRHDVKDPVNVFGHRPPRSAGAGAERDRAQRRVDAAIEQLTRSQTNSVGRLRALEHVGQAL